MKIVKERLDLQSKLERLWSDERFSNGYSTPAVRELIEVYWWALYLNPCDYRGEMRRRSGRSPSGFSPWIRSVYRADAPRWEPDLRTGFGCDVELPRAKRPCGRGGASSRVTDPSTGEWRIITRCRSHGGYNAPEFIAERSLDKASIPIPHPNRGGVLPSYIRASNWPALYAAARPGWTPPAVGIIADDWPVMMRVVGDPLPSVGRSDLRLIPGGAS